MLPVKNLRQRRPKILMDTGSERAYGAGSLEALWGLSGDSLKTLCRLETGGFLEALLEK